MSPIPNSPDRSNGFNGNPSRYNGHYFGEYHGDKMWSDEPNEKKDFGFRDYFSILMRYKWLILVCVILSTSIAYYYGEQIIPEYSAGGTMIIQNLRSPSSAEIGTLMADRFNIGMSDQLDNEIFLFRSGFFTQQVAQKLLEEKYDVNGNLYPLLWRNYPENPELATLETVAGRIRGRMSVAPRSSGSTIVNVRFTSYSSLEAARVVDMIIDTYDEVSREQRRAVTNKAIDFLNEQLQSVNMRMTQSQQAYSDYLYSQGGYLLEQLSATFPTAIMDLEGNIEEFNIQIESNNEKSDRIREELTVIEPEIGRQAPEVIAPQIDAYLNTLGRLKTDRKLMLMRNPLLADNPQAEYGFISLNRDIEQLENEVRTLIDDILKKEDHLLGFLVSSDGGLIERVIQLRRELITLEFENQQIEAQIDNIRERIDQYYANIDKLPEHMRELTRLRRMVGINEQQYSRMFSQIYELEFQRETLMGRGRAIDYASVPTSPFKPDKTNIWLVGFLIGLVLPIAFAVVREWSITEITSLNKITDKGVDVLSVIPDLKPVLRSQFSNQKYVQVNDEKIASELLTLTDSISPFAESFRRLQTNILFAHPDKQMKRLLVTSSGKSEGKTNVAGNLGVALAEAGKRVLIVDCDFRRPRVQNLFGKNNKTGLTDYLFDRKSFEDVIQATVVPGLDLVLTGDKPPNPSAISQSKKLAEFLEKTSESYDHILIDTAPIGIITDAASIIRQVDGVVVVVRFGETKEPQLDQSLDHLKRIHAPVLGSVLVGFEPKKASGYYLINRSYHYAYKGYYDYSKDSV